MNLKQQLQKVKTTEDVKKRQRVGNCVIFGANLTKMILAKEQMDFITFAEIQVIVMGCGVTQRHQ